MRSWENYRKPWYSARTPCSCTNEHICSVTHAIATQSEAVRTADGRWHLQLERVHLLLIFVFRRAARLPKMAPRREADTTTATLAPNRRMVDKLPHLYLPNSPMRLCTRRSLARWARKSSRPSPLLVTHQPMAPHKLPHKSSSLEQVLTSQAFIVRLSVSSMIFATSSLTMLSPNSFPFGLALSQTASNFYIA